MRNCREQAARVAEAAPPALPGPSDYVGLMEWNRVKRMLAELAAKCIRERLGDVVLEVYYTDLSGGEVAEVAGRDIDLVIVVREDADVDAVERAVEETLRALQVGRLARLVEGKPVFEVHVVRRGSTGYRASLASARYTPPVKL